MRVCENLSWVMIILAMAAMLSCGSGSGQGVEDLPLLTPSEMTEELHDIYDRLKSEHPGLYWYTSEGELQSAFEQALAYASTQKTSLDHFRNLSELVAMVKCGHTRVLPSPSIRQHMHEAKLLPFTILVNDEGVYIDKSFDSTAFLPEYQLIAIDEQPMDEILQIIYRRLSADGQNMTGKRKELQRSWPFYYHLYFNASVDRFQATVVDREGRASSVMVDGMTLQQLLAAGPPRQEEEMLELELQEEKDLAILSIRTFNESDLTNYERFLKSSFETIKEKDISNLVVDLRGNGGGKDEYGALLVSYLTNEPFRYFEQIEVTPSYQGYGSIVNKNGTQLMTSHSGLSSQQPAKNHFQGQSYVWIDGGCFSTCGDVASVIAANNLSTLIGQETSGGAMGNTSGWSTTFEGKYSDISVNIPQWKYLTAEVSPELEGSGVIPDIEIGPYFRYDLRAKNEYLKVTRAQISRK